MWVAIQNFIHSDLTFLHQNNLKRVIWFQNNTKRIYIILYLVQNNNMKVNWFHLISILYTYPK